MIGGKYCYEEIEREYQIVSTVGDFMDDIIVGFQDGWYYEFRKYYSINHYNEITSANKKLYSKVKYKLREYVHIRTFRNYVTTYKIN